MALFCNCKEDVESLKRQIKEINEVLTTLEIKALETKRQYAKKLKMLDHETPTEETKDLYSSVLLKDNGNITGIK
jgi:hypothetical protein